MPEPSITPHVCALAHDLLKTADELDGGILPRPDAEDRLRAIAEALEVLESHDFVDQNVTLGGFMDALEQQVQAYADFRQHDDALTEGTPA